ncbi:hypothetical protein A9179_09440 [Pseudomonas alcaligenes]|uniref:Chemotaxis protein cheW n=2 Tax=Pseudomonadaceae TaxID=135621 RepID=A0A1V0M020_ECTOL|nr:chemotaxis protein CheW [Pseudomonas alcaligenes]ARD68202.1 Chemotaxis protein cheW [Pseudomonas oleovorans]MBC9250494.1 hypothetical protein [Pseudomonas alcaligenes]
MFEPLNDGGGRWAELHERLAELERRIAAGFAPSAAEREAQLQARSREWAQMEPQEHPDAWLEVLCFSLGSETYAIEAGHVAAVLPLPQFTPLPGTPPFVLGIVSVRGHIVSVLDLRVLLELPMVGLSDKNFLAILQGPEMEFAVLIDRVLGITRISRDSLQGELANLSGVRARYLLGVTPNQWTVLDGARLLGDSALRIEAED